MNAPLYRITSDFLALVRDLEARDDLPDEAIRDTLEAAVWEVEAKLRDVIGYALQLEAEARMVKTREDELAERRKRLEGRAAWLRHYALDSMRASRIDRLESSDFTARPRENPGAVQIVDEALLPVELVRVRTLREPDKGAIRERLLGGVEVPGAALRVAWRLDVR